MNEFNWSKALGFGVLIWAIMFLLVWATVGIGIFSAVGTQIMLSIIAAVITYLFAVSAKSSGVALALGYGAVFAAVGIILDMIFSQQFISGLFGLWTYYFAYAMVFFTPSIELGFRGGTNARTAL